MQSVDSRETNMAHGTYTANFRYKVHKRALINWKTLREKLG